MQDMSQRRSQRGGAAAAEGGGSQGPTSADGEVRIGLNDLVLGNCPGAPQYGRVFSQAASLRFYAQYAEYERAMKLSNNAQSILRPVPSVAQLLRQSIRCARRGLILMGLNYRKTIYARRLRSTQNVGPTILSTHFLRRLRCSVG